MENDAFDDTQLFRWSKWIDGNGKLWIVTALGGYFKQSGAGRPTLVELLDADSEQVQEFPYRQVQAWIRQGSLKRVEGPILI